MYKHAIINPEGKVVNIIIWDGQDKWSPPKDHTVIQNDSVYVNDTYDFDKKIIVKNVIPPSEIIEVVAERNISLEDIQKQLDELKSQLIQRV